MSSTISYYGYSYGTYLGQVYATLFPTHVRRMVLDSNVDPRRVWYGANLDQDVAFEITMAEWFAWVAKNDAHLSPRRDRGSSQEALLCSSRPRWPRSPPVGVVGSDEWNDVFLSAGYYQFTWPTSPRCSQLVGTSTALGPLVQEFKDTDTPGDDNEYAIYDAVQCTDVKWPTSWAKWRMDNDRVYKTAPFETWSNAWYNAPCRTWPAAAGVPVKVNGSQGAAHPAHRRDARRGDALLGQPLDPSPVPEVATALGRGRYVARELPRRQRLRGQRGGGLPRQGNPACAQGRGR